MDASFQNIASLLIAFVSLVFIVFLLTVKSDRKLSNIFLALYLLFFIQDVGAQFTTMYVYKTSPVAGMLISMTTSFLMPGLYLFFKASVYRDFRLTYRSLIHLSGYVVLNGMLIYPYYMKVLAGEFTREYEMAFYYGIWGQMIYILLYVQIITYIILTFIMLRRYRVILVENFSNPDMGNYRWLIQFFTIEVIIESISLVRNVLRFTGSDQIFDMLTVIVNFNMLVYISWLLIKTLNNPGIFTGVYLETQLVKNMVRRGETAAEEPAEAGAGDLSTEDKLAINRLKSHMETEKPFLDDSLSIYDLASQVGMPARDLSILINHKLNRHFFDFVNGYRIELAKEMLGDPARKKLTVLEILYHVGFNSKSSFNTVFRKQTGLTPTEYRNRELRKAK